MWEVAVTTQFDVGLLSCSISLEERRKLVSELRFESGTSSTRSWRAAFSAAFRLGTHVDTPACVLRMLLCICQGPRW